VSEGETRKREALCNKASWWGASPKRIKRERTRKGKRKEKRKRKRGREEEKEGEDVSFQPVWCVGCIRARQEEQQQREGPRRGEDGGDDQRDAILDRVDEERHPHS